MDSQNCNMYPKVYRHDRELSPAQAAQAEYASSHGQQSDVLPSDFLAYDRVIAHSGDTFEGMAGTILSVHALASRHPFAFVSLDDPRYHDDQLWFPLAELAGSAERMTRTVSR